MRVSRIEGVASVVLALFGCRGAPVSPAPTALEIRVESDPGVPLRDVAVEVDGRPVGRTDGRGSVKTTLVVSPGSTIRVEPGCPDRHESSATTRVLHLRDYQAGGSSPPIEVRVFCRPSVRTAAFVVRARNGPGLPVLLDEKPVATTDDAGVAHFSATGPPGTEYVVRLDASRRPELLPRRATYPFTLHDRHSLFVIDQSFKVRKRTKSAPGSRRPIIKIE